MKIKTAAELMVDNCIVKHFAGSHAYGTATPTSDIDYRGIFVADPINLLTPFYKIEESVDVTEEDTKLYELSQFMKLVLDCNPNILESLWTDPVDVVFKTPAYDLLVEHRDELLSSKVAFTYSGYAVSQLTRIKGHNKWISNPQPVDPPMQIDFISLVHNFTSKKIFKIDLRQFRSGYRLVPYDKNLFGVYEAPGYETFASNGTLNTVYEPTENTFIKEHLGGLIKTRRTPLFIVKFNQDVYNEHKTKWQQYWQWKTNRNKARSELEEQFGYDCYTDDTEFLTSTGWKTFDQVAATDTLATFNRFTQKLEYQYPSERIEGTYTGNLYHLTGYHVDSLVTANHHMYVRPYSRTNKKEGSWDFERAAELSETFDTLNVIRPKLNRQLLPPGVNRKIFDHVHMLDYLRLVGWYVSDGTMNFYEPSRVKHMMISQSKPQSRLTQTLNKQINSGKIKCSEYTYSAGAIANYPERRWLFNRELSQLIYDDCGHGSKHKRLPAWCFFLTKREMTTLLVSLIHGDGTKKNHQDHTYVYYTINRLLADDVQRLAFLCGFETSRYGPYPIDSTFETESDMYHVHINMRPRATRRHVRSASVKKVPVENQRIVCFMVNNYTLVTRRNGHVGLHGNTKHAMHLVRLLRTGAEILEHGHVLVKRPDAAELLDIRNGKWTYEELVQYAEHMDNHIRDNLYRTTALRKKPDVKAAAQLILQVQDLIWSK